MIFNFVFVAIDFVDLFKQPGRIVVITGGNRGIGADVVEKLLQCEISVIMGECQTKKMNIPSLFIRIIVAWCYVAKKSKLVLLVPDYNRYICKYTIVNKNGMK